MKKSKRVLATVMSALLILPSFVLPFSGAAAEGDAALDEPYYVVGRLQKEGEKAETKSEVLENTGDDAATYPNKVTTGAITVRAEEPIDLTGLDTNNLAFKMEVTVTRLDGKTGDGALSYTGNQIFTLKDGSTDALQLMGQPYLTHFTSNYGNAAGKTITYTIPWNYVYNNNAIKKNDVTQIDNFYWFVYNDSWKVDLNGNGVYDDVFGLNVMFENARVVDMSRLPDGSRNPVVATWYDGGEIVADYQGSRKWNETNNSWQNNNTMSHFGFTNWSNTPTAYTVKPEKVADLQVEFDVMVENPDNVEKFDASKFNGILRLKIGDTQVDYGYGWNNFVKNAGEWAHVTVPLANMFKDNKALTEEADLGSLQMFAYDGNDLRTDPDNDTPEANQPRFVHAICHTKGVKLVDTSLIEVPVDRTALETAIADAEAKLSDGNTYTADTKKALEDALAAAKAVAENADQETVDTAVKSLTDAIEALVEEVVPVPDNYVLISNEKNTTNESHGLTAELTAVEVLDLTQEAYQGRELFVTFKMKVDKTAQFPASITGSDADWLKFLRNGGTTVGNAQINGQTCANGYYANVSEAGVWKDVTIAVPADATSIEKLSVQFWNDLNSATGNDDDQNHGVVFSIKDAYLVVGDVKPVARWSAMNETLRLLNEGNAFYFDWKTADGIPDQNTAGGGIDMSGKAENGANAQYVFKATIAFDALQESAVKPADMIKAYMFRMRSSVVDSKNMEADWYNLTAEDMTVNEAGDGVTIAVPLSKVSKGNMDWTDVKQLLIRTELKDEYQEKDAQGNKPSGRVESTWLTMTLSDVKVVKVEEEPTPVDRTALEAAIKDAEAKTEADYTAESWAAMVEKLNAAKAVAEDADQATVDAATKALTDAIAALVEKEPEPVEVTIDDLKAAVAAAQEKMDKGVFEQEGLVALKAAIAEANEIVAAAEDEDTTNDPTPEAIAEAVKTVNAKAAALVAVDTKDGVTVSLIDGPVTTVAQHTMNTIVPNVNLAKYGPREGFQIRVVMHVNKDDATFGNLSESAQALTEAELVSWIKAGHIRMKYQDAEGNDVSIDSADINCTVSKYGESFEATMAVPEAAVDAGNLTYLEVFIYNNLHQKDAAYSVDVEGSNGMTVTFEALELVVGVQKETGKTALKALLDAQKTGETLNGYTNASVKAYNKLFETAKAVYDNAEATDEEVAEQVAILEKADQVLKLDVSGPITLPVLTETLTSGAKDFMEVNKTFTEPINFGVYGDRESVKLQLKVTVNKSDNWNSLPEAMKALTPEEIIKYVVNGSVNLWGAGTGDEHQWKGVENGVRFSLGEGDYEYVALGENFTILVDVPDVILKAGMLSKIQMYMYNDMHNLDAELYTKADDIGLTVSLTDVQLLLGAAKAADKTALTAAITKAEELTAEELATYTDASVKVFQDALADAKSVAEDTSVSQADVDAAAKALTDAQAALEKKGTPKPIVYGDLTDDGQVKPEDALKALQAATSKITLTDDEKTAADVDGDGKLTANDALNILQYATGKISQFLVESK